MSTTGIVVKQWPDNKSEGITLDELANAVQRALAADLPGSSRVRVDVGWRSQVKELRIGEGA